MKLKWCIFEKVPPSVQDTVPGEYWQHTLGAFDRKEQADKKIEDLHKLPEFEDRKLCAKQWPVA